MSKVQGKDSELQNNLTGSGIVSELDSLDSHLRDLEKNIAVAREFIKLADESYSELRHKWNLIHEEARNKTGTGISEKTIHASKKRRSPTDTLAEPEENAVSKTEELIGVSIEKTPRSERSKSRNKPERGQKQNKESEETTDSTDHLDNAKPSKAHESRHRRYKSR
jgi:hypothetical protein